MNRIVNLGLSLFFGWMGTVLIPLPAAQAEGDLYIRFDGVSGSGTAAEYKDWIPVLRYEHKLSSMTDFQSGGGETGKVEMGDFVFLKKIDTTSPLLYVLLCRGTSIPKAVLECLVTQDSSKPVVVFRYTFEDLLISSVESTNPGSLTEAVEKVSFRFARIKWEYYSPDPRTGSPSGAPVSKGWDVQKSVEIVDPATDPSPTPARPTPTTTPVSGGGLPIMTIPAGSVAVTDDFHSVNNLCGGEDADPAGNRELMIRWNSGMEDAVNYHIYAIVDNSPMVYLGQTGRGDVSYYQWRANSPYVSESFRRGPEGDHEYLFVVYAMVSSPLSSRPTPGGKFSSLSPVYFSVEE